MATVKTVTLVANTATDVTVDSGGTGSVRTVTVKNLTSGTVVYVAIDGSTATVKGDGCIAVMGGGYEAVSATKTTSTTATVNIISNGTPDVSVQAGG